jgi:hypothetical protein
MCGKTATATATTTTTAATIAIYLRGSLKYIRCLVWQWAVICVGKREVREAVRVA